MSSDRSQVYFCKALVYFLNVSLKQSFNICTDQSGIAPAHCGVASTVYMLLQPAGSLSRRKQAAGASGGFLHPCFLVSFKGAQCLVFLVLPGLDS